MASSSERQILGPTLFVPGLHHRSYRVLFANPSLSSPTGSPNVLIRDVERGAFPVQIGAFMSRKTKAKAIMSVGGKSLASVQVTLHSHYGDQVTVERRLSELWE
jgi:hypothetical protein